MAAQPPIIPPNATPEDIKKIVSDAQSKQQNDGLMPLTSKLQEVITTIGQTSLDMRKTFEALYKTYTDAVDDRKHVVSDVASIVNNNKQAIIDLAAKELELKEQKTSADARFAELQQQQAILQQAAEKATAKAAQLESANKQLVSLHKSQIVDIHTNIQTLATLRTELDKLKSGIQKIHQQAVALGCIKLYTKYPLLIKARQISKDVTVQNTIDMNYLTVTSSQLMPRIKELFDHTVAEIQSILGHLKTITSSGQPFWSNYLSKVTETQRFLTTKIGNTDLTGLQYLIYCWTIESLPENTLPIFNVALLNTLNSIQSQILADP